MKKTEPAKPQLKPATGPAPIKAEAELPEFYLVVAPGLEDIAERELAAWVPSLKPEKERGGLTIYAPLHEGLRLNRCLKVPTRILVRIADFGCRDFPKLFKKMQNLDWARWVADDRPLLFKASSHGSRLFVKKRIEETARDGRKAYLKKLGVAANESLEPIQVFIRLKDDVCFVSLDTSGDRLHKRGVREMSSEAPLRESIAASLLWALEAVGGPVAANSVELVDPMMGAGTFFLEAQSLKSEVLTREFAFDAWGGRETTGLATQASGAQTSDDQTSKQASTQDVYKRFLGFEIDNKTVEAANANWRSQKTKGELEIITSDFFTAQPLDKVAGDTKRWLICNPPYGERLRIEGKLSDYYEKLFSQAEKVASPDVACFLLPDKARPTELKHPKNWRRAGALRMTNGGLPVTAVLFDRSISARRESL